VGVGIATGEAFVGNIQTVDCMIWSAVGNTTNPTVSLEAQSSKKRAQGVAAKCAFNGS
jgi:class 3 adenylate cyclase